MDAWGGLLQAVGSGAAGGFKAMGENADDSIKAKLDAAKQKIIEEREMNIARFNQTYQKERDTKADLLSRDLNRDTIASHEKISEANRTIASEDRREQIAANERIHKGQQELSRAVQGQSASLRAMDQRDRADAKKSAQEYQQAATLLNKQAEAASTEAKREKVKQDFMKFQMDAMTGFDEAVASGNYERAKDIATAAGLPLTDRKATRPSKGLLEWGDQEITVPAIDRKALTQMRSVAKPVAPQAGQMQSAHQATPKPKTALDIENELKQSASKPTATQDKPAEQSNGILSSLREVGSSSELRDAYSQKMSKSPPNIERKTLGGAVSEGIDSLRESVRSSRPHQGLRADGTEKGNGFFGPLKMKDGSNKVASEMSIGVEINGKEVEIPILVPTLSQGEVDYLLSGNEPTPEIIEKAERFAQARIEEGKSPFAGETEVTRPRR